MDADPEWSDEEFYATPLPGTDVLLPSTHTCTEPERQSEKLAELEPNEKPTEPERPTEKQTEPERPPNSPTLPERPPYRPAQPERPNEKPAQPKSESSDDDIPLCQIQKRLQKKRKRQAKQVSTESSELDDSGHDKTYLPSNESLSCEDSDTTPLIKRKSKWLRKRIRPLKREEGRRLTQTRDNRNKNSKKINRQNIHSKEKQREASGDELQRVLRKSRTEHNVNSILQRFAEKRLSNLLDSNSLERKSINPDGNCYFNAVLSQITSQFSMYEFRSELCKHLLENEEHYKGYMANRSMDELDISEQYVEKVNQLKGEGVWNVEMSDILPLATANFLNKNITIYTSRLNNPIIHVSPDLNPREPTVLDEIKLSYLAVRGFEHYDACVQGVILNKHTSKSGDTSTPVQANSSSYEQNANTMSKTPLKSSNPTGAVITPRKGAEYVSPKKVKVTRKRTRNTEQWKKSIRKDNRNTGKAYISAANKRVIASKSVQPANCNNCKNKCLENVPEETRLNIFNYYYDKDMTFERKRDFICQHIEIRATSKRYGRTYKHISRRFF